MPSWGRPSGGRQKGKRGQAWERQRRDWEEARRFEELDSDFDDDDGQGVGLNDTMQFTGAEISRGVRRRRKQDYSDESDALSEEDGEYGGGEGAQMQLALRDKEGLLVQKALERIRRAQMLGKTNVKLTPSENEALQRKIQRDQAKGRKPSSPKTSSRRSSNSRLNGPPSAVQPTAVKRRSRSSLNPYEESAPPPSSGRSAPPGFVVQGRDGKPVFTPIGYHPSQDASPYGLGISSSRSGSRSASSHSLQQFAPPVPQFQHPNPQKRYYPVPDHQSQPPIMTRSPPSPQRSLPDDPNWIPRPRSSSSTHSLHATEPYAQYKAYSPPIPQMPTQYIQQQSRRNVSGPAELQHPGVRALQPPPPSFAQPHAHASSSDPSLLRREYSGESNRRREAESESEEDEEEDEEDGDEDEDDEDDEEGDGVQVDVIPYGKGYEMNVAREGRAGGVGGGSSSSSGRQRKGRR
ncbi:hypothetical protein MMC09_004354 [Bachmanniomyces sp. S44760]|nr:hypothetical protein [Bachmanniomyces sp. S44760]